MKIKMACSPCGATGYIREYNKYAIGPIKKNCIYCNGVGFILVENNIGKENQMITKDDIKANQFYVGSNSIFTRNNGKGWGHNNINAAIEHAKSLLRGKDETEEVFIVKIVKVVRKKQQPIEVITVK